jgi:ornithine carbamoyltransferase
MDFQITPSAAVWGHQRRETPRRRDQFLAALLFEADWTAAMRHIESMFRLSVDDCRAILRISKLAKARWAVGDRPALLPGRMMTLVFEKPSLRTRVSFESAVAHLGGRSVFLTAAEAGLNGRESVADVARVLRTFSQQLVEDFARYAGCAVINGLSDSSHPCQALSDVFTMSEAFGAIEGRSLAYIGDGNNVARSLAVTCALLGLGFTIASPLGYELSDEFVARLRSAFPQGKFQFTSDPRSAVANADVVYTDVWASMGQEAEQELRKRAFAPYQVNADLMKRAPSHARFMHCLPAKRGLEVTDEVLDGPQSIAIPQAENRMHVAKGILLWQQGIEDV